MPTTHSAVMARFASVGIGNWTRTPDSMRMPAAAN